MTTRCLRLDVERYACGELDKQQAEEMKLHLEKCAECSSYAAKLQAQRTEFLQKHPFATFTRAHAPLRQIQWYKRIIRSAFRPAMVPIYGMLILTAAVVPYLYTTHFSGDETVRFKGRNAVTYIYQRDGVTHQRSSSDIFRAGDRVQVLYSLSKLQNVGLVSIDTRGNISFYDPDSQSSVCSIPVAPASSIAYPVSIELDDAPGAELIVVIFSEKPISTGSVTSWIQKQLSLSNGLAGVHRALAASASEIDAEISALLLKKE